MMRDDDGEQAEVDNLARDIAALLIVIVLVLAALAFLSWKIL